ncbi:hypothetical protein FQN50_005798 [Emmonsiellopsis sp. PD_5]|nr:hypothetical protein FQN50_005798 [Emmonsiellopsis sp. PD_5]
MAAQNILDLPAELLMRIIDFLVPNDIIPALHAIESLVKYITPQHAIVKDNEGATIIHQLVRSEETGLLQSVLSNGVNCSVPNAAGETPLSVACDRPNVAIIKLLLHAGAEMSECKHNALVTAASCQNMEAVQFFLDLGIDVNQVHVDKTALTVAVRRNDEELVRLLIDAGADPSIPHQYTPLMDASFYLRPRIVKMLLDVGGNISHRNARLDTALHCAVWGIFDDSDSIMDGEHIRGPQHVYDEVIRLLIDAGIDTTRRDTKGRTPLLLAIEICIVERPYDIPTIKTLIDLGADASTKNFEGRSPLHVASKGVAPVVKLLIQAGVPISTRCRNGKTALHYAAECPLGDPTKLLVEAGIYTDVQDKEGSTALHYAARNKHDQVLPYLLSSMKNISAVDHEGRTALHYAAKQGWDKIQMLLSGGINPFIQDHSSLTALTYAARGGHKEVAQLLLDAEAKADPNVLSQSCQSFSLIGPVDQLRGRRRTGPVQREDAQISVLPPNEELRNIHTKCYRSGSVHSLAHVIQDLAATGDLQKIKPIFELWRAEVGQALPAEEIPSLYSHPTISEAIANAARNCHSNVVEYLLQMGVHITLALIKAASEGGRTEVYQTLLDHEWDINARYEHQTSLMCCIKNPTLVKWHLDHGADPEIRSEELPNGETNKSALEIAAGAGAIDSVKVLVEHGVDLQNTLALIDATRSRYPSGNAPVQIEIMNYLLNCGVDIDRVDWRESCYWDWYGRGTALMAAVEITCTERVRLLLERGANKEIGSHHVEDGDNPDPNRTPLRWAEYMVDYETVNLLRTM